MGPVKVFDNKARTASPVNWNSRNKSRRSRCGGLWRWQTFDRCLDVRNIWCSPSLSPEDKIVNNVIIYAKQGRWSHIRKLHQAVLSLNWCNGSVKTVFAKSLELRCVDTRKGSPHQNQQGWLDARTVCLRRAKVPGTARREERGSREKRGDSEGSAGTLSEESDLGMWHKVKEARHKRQVCWDSSLVKIFRTVEFKEEKIDWWSPGPRGTGEQRAAPLTSILVQGDIWPPQRGGELCICHRKHSPVTRSKEWGREWRDRSKQSKTFIKYGTWESYSSLLLANWKLYTASWWGMPASILWNVVEVFKFNSFLRSFNCYCSY